MAYFLRKLASAYSEHFPEHTASFRFATRVGPDRASRFSALHLPLNLAKIQASPFTVSTSEVYMIRMNLTATNAEPRTDDVSDILAQAQALAERVEAMPDGPMKEKLRAALAEIRANVEEFKPEVRHAG